MRESPIFIIETDAARLRGLLATRVGSEENLDQEHLSDLASELERAVVVNEDVAPGGFVMMNSQVQVVDLHSGERRDVTLVFPTDADPASGRVSVLAPLGCALMGNRPGEIVEWEMPGGLRRLRIDKVTAPPGIPQENES
ncbi:MAG: GreA/GreB family elongation factor [Pseudomonadota bacterium]